MVRVGKDLEVQDEIEFIQAAINKVRKEGVQGSDGSLNKFVYEVMAGRNGGKMRELRQRAIDDPSGLYEEVVTELRSRPDDDEYRKGVAAEFAEYQKSRAGSPA